MKDLITADLSQWFDGVPWSDVMVYEHASRTVTVPQRCKQDWFKAFVVPYVLWNEHAYDDAIKLHFMMIRMLAAPVRNRSQISVTKTVQSRLDRFLSGDWEGLWAEANDEQL